MPYRVDIPHTTVDALDRLIELGAIDAEASEAGGLAALMPDSITAERVASALGVASVQVTPAAGRDADSVWVLRPRPVHAGRLRILPSDMEAEPGTVRLIDGPAFGTGLHATTALCLEIIVEAVEAAMPEAMLDVGTGSGVLAIAALVLGVPRALGVDVDEHALRTAAENASLNGVDGRLRLARGGPDAVAGTWPLVVANVLAAPLIELAPVIVRRVGHRGRLVLSGIPASVEGDVHDAYRRAGMQRVRTMTRAGWVAIVFQATW